MKWVMKIYLVQHGDALPPEINPERPLSPQGKADVERLAAFLGQHSFPLSAILHSQKARARETAEILGHYLASGLKLEEHANLAPNDPIEPILDLIQDGMMIVSHLPYLQRLSGHLVVHDQDAIVINFDQGKVICLEKIDGHFAFDWAIGTNHTP